MYESTRLNTRNGEFCLARVLIIALTFLSHASSVADPLSREFSHHPTEHFRIAHRGEPAKAQLVGEVLEQTYARVDASLRALLLEPTAPMMSLDWVCFSDRVAFEAYAATQDRADVSNLNGYYSPRSGRVVLYWGAPSFAQEFTPRAPNASANASGLSEGQLVGSLTSKPLLPIIIHESVHQIAYSRDLQQPGRRYPLWFTEGLALYLEGTINGDAPLTSDDWAESLLQLRDSGGLLSLSEFMLVTEVSYTDLERIRPLYAQAWGTFAFFAETRSEELTHYLRALRKSHPLAPLRLDDVERIVGTIDALESEWIDWLARFSR